MRASSAHSAGVTFDESMGVIFTTSMPTLRLRTDGNSLSMELKSNGTSVPFASRRMPIVPPV